MVGQPGEYYLTHFSPADGEGKTIAQNVFNQIQYTDLYENLKVIGTECTDVTASMTGPHSGFIRSLEELLDRPLQWAGQYAFCTPMNCHLGMFLYTSMVQPMAQIRFKVRLVNKLTVINQNCLLNIS